MNRAKLMFERDPKSRVELIEMNVQAAKAAKHMNAPRMIARFTEEATKVCKKQDWLNIPSTLIDLHNLSAEANFALGRFEEVRTSALTVAARVKTPEEAVSARVLYMQTLGAQQCYADALAQARNIMASLGENHPKATTFNVIRESMRVARLSKGKSDDFFKNLPMITNPNLIWTMKILEVVSIYGWNFNVNEAVLAYFRMMNITMKYGRCPYTPLAYAGYAAMVAAMGEDQKGFRFSELAANEIFHKSQIPAAYIMIHSFGSHLNRPVSHSLQAALEGYRAGLEYGDIISGTICVSSTITNHGFCYVLYQMHSDN
jgi:predicted ATPase